MKTAIEQLQDNVQSKLSEPMSANFKLLFTEAKEIEKQQIIKAFDDASPLSDLGEDYFKNNYQK
jgi:hypothetical protein